MKSDTTSKLFSVLNLVLLMIITIEVSAYFVLFTVLYSLHMGAYFRGENWILGFRKVVKTEEVVK